MMKKLLCFTQFSSQNTLQYHSPCLSTLKSCELFLFIIVNCFYLLLGAYSIFKPHCRAFCQRIEHFCHLVKGPKPKLVSVF